VVCCFRYYLGGDFEKAVKKMEKRIGEEIPSSKLITSGLSIRVGGMKGPVIEEEYLRCEDFGKKIANQLLRC